MAAHQAPPSLGFSRQDHWSGLPFPSPVRESEVDQSCPTLSGPMDCRQPGSSVHGIFQARVLEWGAIGLAEIKFISHALEGKVLTTGPPGKSLLDDFLCKISFEKTFLLKNNTCTEYIFNYKLESCSL